MRYLLATSAFSNPELLEKCIRSWPKLDCLVDRLIYFDGYKWSTVFYDLLERQVLNEIEIPAFGEYEHYGCSGAWNRLLDIAFIHNEDVDALIVVGSDTEFKDNFLEEYINELEAKQLDFAVGKSPVIWNCWCITKKCFEVVGSFDLNLFPCYYEDNDYHTRVHIAGLKWDYIGDSSKFEHYGSATIHLDENYNWANCTTFGMNGEYYRSKWGGMPGNEKYLYPFDNPEFTIKDWTLDEEKYDYKKKIWNKN